MSSSLVPTSAAGHRDGSAEPVLVIDSVSKTYSSRDQTSIEALASSSFAVGDGEFVSLLGPSGCGKSTMLKICAGLAGATSGRVSFRGTPEGPPPEAYGMVFQSPALLAWRTVVENVRLPAVIAGTDSDQVRERATALLDLVGLSDVMSKYPSELSGGMQQRTAIARALLLRPALLFMDEPFGALDAMTREHMNDELQRIHATERASVLFVTHSISEAVLLSDRIIVLSSRPGRVIGNIAVPLDRPRSPDAVRGSHVAQRVEQQVRALLFGRDGGGETP